MASQSRVGWSGDSSETIWNWMSWNWNPKHAALGASILATVAWFLSSGSAAVPGLAVARSRPVAPPTVIGTLPNSRAEAEGIEPLTEEAAEPSASLLRTLSTGRASGLPALSEDSRQRFEELKRLVHRNPAQAAMGLRSFVEETRDDGSVQLQRLNAVALLGAIRDVPTQADLAMIYEEGDDAIRRAAALALERQGDASLVHRELFEMQRDFTATDGGVRMRAVEQVARMESRHTAPYLLPMLSDPNSEVRMQALDGLRRAGDSSVVHEVQALLSDPVQRVRDRAERTLTALRSAPSDETPPGENG